MNIQLTEKEQKARGMICLPLDGLNTMNELYQRVEELSDFVGLFKIGKGSFTRFGPEAINLVQANGSNVFLDLKYHDIPETVKDASAAATELGVYMFNVHASGGMEMMRAAVEGAQGYSDKHGVRKPKIIGVTVLTSINDSILENDLLVGMTAPSYASHLAKLARYADLDGIVCSALDLNTIKESGDFRDDFMYVTPGIQGVSTSAGSDQKRVATPSYAVQNGSSVLVIGRAITGQKTPELRQQAAYEILQDMAKHL